MNKVKQKRKRKIRVSAVKKKIREWTHLQRKKKLSDLLELEKLRILIYNDVYFTHDLNSFFPCEIVSLLQEFNDIFSKDLSQKLFPLKGIEH